MFRITDDDPQDIFLFKQKESANDVSRSPVKTLQKKNLYSKGEQAFSKKDCMKILGILFPDKF